MADILLIQPPIRDFYLTAKRTVPYGLACIASSLEKEGFSVAIFDGLATSKSHKIQAPDEMNYLDEYYGKEDISSFALFNGFKHFGYSFEHIGKEAAKTGAFLVGISSLFTPYAEYALMTAEAVKAYSPDCKIVLGGHHATALYDKVIKNSAVDFVIRGEAEESMVLLAAAIKENKSLDLIPGIVYRKTNEILHVNNPALIDNLDKQPLPAISLLKHNFYKRGKSASIVISASRGCPLKCSYCSVSALSYLKYRKRSIESVLRELDNNITGNKAAFIDFEDENLSLDKKWFTELLCEIRSRYGKSGLELRAMNGLLPTSLDEEMICLMKESGFKTLNLSLGSSLPEQLKRFKRPDVREAFDKVLLLAEKYNLKAVGYIIAGAPYMMPEDSVSDLLYFAERKVLAGVSIFYPSPGSSDFELCRKLEILPQHYSLMRSSALPVSHATDRKQAVTILRLGRILNFMKSLIDSGYKIPEPEPFTKDQIKSSERTETGIKLLKWFLFDAKIRGADKEGCVYDHSICNKTAGLFAEKIIKAGLKGC